MNKKPSVTLLPAAIVSLWLIGAYATAAAREPGAALTYPPGISLGSPTGTDLPEGFTFQAVTAYYENQPTVADGSSKTSQHVYVTSVAPRLFWTAPWKIFGATEMIYVIQPIVTLSSTNVPGHPVGAHYTTTGLGSPLIFPINLSWDLGHGWHTAAIFGFLPPTGGYDVHATLNTGVNFWTYEPELAVSYLAHGWDLTAHAVYQINGTNEATGYKSGNVGIIDLTATRKFGHWEVGLVTYYDKQVSADQNSGKHYPRSFAISQPEQWAAGPLLGYNFGPVNIQTYVTHDFMADDRGNKGTRFWARFIVPLGH